MKIPGNTKLVKIIKVIDEFDIPSSVNIYAKVENTNPSGSIKDRTVYNMLLDYKEKGMLKDGSLIIEATSGNTGISLAYFSKYFNYRAIIVMPKSVSVQRREMISKYGGEVYLVDGGMQECKDASNKLLKDNPGSFIFNQFDNLSNPEAHVKTTGPEIDNQLDNVGYIFAGIGTGGTISGIGKYFKENSSKSNPKIIGIEPEESPLLTKGYASSHKIQGIGANFVPNTYLSKYVDEVISVKGDDSIEMAKTIRSLESIDIGISSGASLLGAIKYMRENNITNANVLVIFPDKGDRYTW